MPAPSGRPRSVQIGFILFAVGLVFVLITVLPFFLGAGNRPLWLNLGCLLAPIGLVVAVTGAVRAGTADQRAARQAAADQRAARQAGADQRAGRQPLSDRNPDG